MVTQQRTASINRLIYVIAPMDMITAKYPIPCDYINVRLMRAIFFRTCNPWTKLLVIISLPGRYIGAMRSCSFIYEAVFRYMVHSIRIGCTLSSWITWPTSSIYKNIQTLRSTITTCSFLTCALPPLARNYSAEDGTCSVVCSTSRNQCT